jgi:RNA polymerase sigma factor (sigma-70 family)
MTRPAATAPTIANVRRWLGRLRPVSAPDAELLRRFVRDRDEAAYAALVDRHGPMVLGAARRLVGDDHAAEDVFQATFVILARRARQFRHPAAVPAWLHRTACNLARTAVRARKRRRRAESRAAGRPAGDPLDDLSSRELLALLDEELRRLPEAFRLPLVLCCLEGRSQEEAAALLGWTPGSVKGRLERGRQRLKARLARRGLTFAAAVGVPLLVGPPSLAGALRQAALQAALGGSPLSPGVAALTDGALGSALIARCRALLIAAALGLVGVGTGWALLARPKGTGESAASLAVAAGEKPTSPRADAAGDGLPERAVARLGSSRLRIGNSAFALTPDGRVIVTVSPEGVVRRFDAQTGRLLERRQIGDRRDADPTGQAQAQLSADGKTALIQDGRLTVWDVPSGKMIFRLLPGKGRSPDHPALSPDGKLLALTELGGARDSTRTLRVYDLKTGRGKDLGSGEFNVYRVCFSAGGTRVVLSQVTARPGVGDQTFACFDVPAGKQLWRLPRKGHEFALSPDGKTVVSAVDGAEPGFQIIETDPGSGKPVERFQPWRPARPYVRVVFAPDNRTLVMNYFDRVMTWDVRTGDAVTRFKLPRARGQGWGTELGAISPDGRTVVTNLGYLQRWDLTTGKAFFGPPPDDGLGGPIEHLAFTPDGKEVVASSWCITSGRWEVATGKQLGFRPERLGRQLIATPGGLRALRCDSDRSPYEVTVYDPVAGKALHTVRWAAPDEVGINGLRAYALTADGKTLLVAHGHEPGAAVKSYVTACDVASGRRLARSAVAGTLHLAGTPHFPSSPFSPCGRWVALGGKVYHVGTGTALFAPAGAPGERLLPGEWWKGSPVWFSGDGRLLAGRLSRKAGGGAAADTSWLRALASPGTWSRKAGDGAAADTLAVWELASGAVLARFPKAGRVAQVALAPDGRTVALLDGWGVHLHDLLTGKRLAAYPAPDVLCNSTDRGCGTQTLAFAPDGRTLATGHLDGTVLLWKVPPAPEGSKEVAERDREGLWADLGSDVPGKARAAVERLARRPAAAVALLAGRFRPPPADPALAALVKDLDSDVFATREEATRKLREFGPRAEPALRRELAATASLEAKRRIEAVLAGLAPPLLRLPLAGDTLRGVRAIEVLERAGTPEARRLLQGWAGQTRDLHLAAEARAAQGRAGKAPRR